MRRYIDTQLRIGGESTMQGRGGVNPSPGTGESWGLEIYPLSPGIYTPEAQGLGGFDISRQV